jgi:hypothetical protein
MRVVWIAIWLYIVGVATVLYLRPAFMFHNEGGGWKEFGLGTTLQGVRTVFPFWLFTIAWAIVSYAIATMGALYLSASVAAAGAYNPATNLAQPISKVGPLSSPPVLPQQPVIPTPPAPAPTPAPMAAMTTPGYYVLQPSSLGGNEMPRYVYYGTTPPPV